METLVVSRKENNPNKRPNKHLVEKKRRDRINHCLIQLKTLVLGQLNKDESKYSKLEKADILEMTVHHLKSLQRQQANSLLPQTENLMNKYRAGYTECAQEVFRYLGNVPTQEVKDNVQGRLMQHLSTNITKTEPQEVSPTQTTVLTSLPGNTGIPQYNDVTRGIPTLNVVTSSYQVVPQVALMLSSGGQTLNEGIQSRLAASQEMSRNSQNSISYSQEVTQTNFENNSSRCGKVSCERERNVWRPW